MTTIGKRLKEARIKQGLTQSQAGKLIGLHRPSITETELGRRRVTTEELLEYAKIYDITASELLGIL